MVIEQGWQNFYMLTGAAAATLMGLLFVAITVGGYIPAQRAEKYLRTFVTPALIYYFQALFTACLAVIPLQSLLFLAGAEIILGIIDIYLGLHILRRIRTHHMHDIELDADYWLWHIMLPVVVGLLLVTSAISFFLHSPYASIELAIVQLLYLSIGLHNTWTLTVWVSMRRGVLESPVREDQKLEK